jgi:K+-sensing histidine kinase KdpD
VSWRRRWLGTAVGVALLVIVTAVLTSIRHDLSLADELLIYLLAVVAVAVIGGLGPAVLAAAAASFCVNWFFTPPLHTLTIDEPKNLLALVLFVLVALSVSSVVHVAARRAKLAAQAEGLEAGNRMRTALLAAVSHDLRTPLATIKASISCLRQPDLSYSKADEQDLLAAVEESADRLDGLIANLLDMSRLQTGALSPLVEPVSVDEVATPALHGLPGAGTVVIDIPEGLPLLRADAGLLERTLANLLSNALRFSPADRPPTLRARTASDGVQIEVVDHGPGVIEDLRQTMFEPFQRLGDQDNTTGVGLGLAVARGFTDAMAGSLAASETAGGGLTMTVTLPTAAAAAAVPSSLR